MKTRYIFTLLLTGLLSIYMNVAPGAWAQEFQQSISVSVDGLSPITLEFGQASGALDAFDASSDLMAPPAPPAGFDARLFQISNDPINEFYRDIRSEKDSSSFSIQVTPKSTTEPAVTLSWTGIMDFQGTLVLEMGGQTADLTQDGSLSLSLPNGLAQAGVITFNVASVGTSTEDLPDQTELTVVESVYPNPVSEAATITYNLGREGQMSLSIYDMLGRRIARLDEGRKPAGTYEVTWEGVTDQDVRISSGTYFIVLEAGTQIATRPLVFAR